jgi:uncharacterized membrane protein YesL
MLVKLATFLHMLRYSNVAGVRFLDIILKRKRQLLRESNQVGKPSIGWAIKFTLGDTYHNLGKVILSNLFWTATFVPCLLVGLEIKKNLSPLLLLLLVGCFLLTSPALAGIFVISRKIAIKEHEIEMRDFFAGTKEHWKKSLVLSLICVIIPLVAGFSLMFYGQLVRASSLSVILWIINVWILIFFFLAQVYFFPLVVGQKMGISQILRTSLLLALNNVGFTFVILLFEIAILLFCSITGVIFLAGVSMIALLQSNAFIEVAKRYTAEEIRKEVKTENHQKKTLRDILRDTFFPWKYD